MSGRRLFQLLAISSWVLCAGCSTAGQGGDPGQTGVDAGGMSGMSGMGGAGGTAGVSGSGGFGGNAGNGGNGGAGGTGCTTNAFGVGVISAELDGERQQLTETIDLSGHESEIYSVRRRAGGLLTTGWNGFWDVELSEPASKQRVEHQGLLRGAVPCDLDGDGDEDIVGVGEQDMRGSGFSTSETRAFLWERVGHELVAHEGFAVVVIEAGGLAVGDVDGDGDLDIVSADSMGPVVMRNEGGFEFTRVEGSSGFGACDTCDVVAMQLDDRDGDGTLDLAAVLDHSMSGGAGTWVSVQHGNGAGVFGDATLSQVSDESRLGTSKINGDINGDSSADFVLTRQQDSNETRVLFGTADGAFLPPQLLDYTINDVIDLDDDGVLDLVTVEEGAIVLRYVRGVDLYEEHRYELALRASTSIVMEQAHAGGAPKVHALYDQSCPSACTPECGACVFGGCVECLNHSDCETDVCELEQCRVPDDEDAGVN